MRQRKSIPIPRRMDAMNPMTSSLINCVTGFCSLFFVEETWRVQNQDRKRRPKDVKTRQRKGEDVRETGAS